MAEEVEQLLLQPFRDIVEKGKTAIKNAEIAGGQTPGEMRKAAQNLVKEGDRALKKIEPMAMMTYEEYGGSFINAIKENDDIAQFRKELVDLLWDFDDYVKVDEFDGGKFDELQKASRKAAPQIWDTLKRMKLPAPPPALISPPPSESETPMSPGTSPWRNSDNSGPQHPPKDFDRTNSRHFGPSDPPPTPPSADPWQISRESVTVHPIDGEIYDQPLPAAPDSPTIPPTQLVSSAENQFGPPRRLDGDDGLHGDPEQYVPTTARSQASDRESWPSPLKPRRWTDSTQNSGELVPVPPPRSDRRYTHGSGGSGSYTKYESAVSLLPSAPPPTTGDPSKDAGALHTFGPGRETDQQGNSGHPPRTTSMMHHNPPAYVLSSHKPSTESINSSVFDVIDSLAHQQSMKIVNPPKSTPYQRDGMHSMGYLGPPPLYQIPPIPPRRHAGTNMTSKSPEARDMDDMGMIPVHTEASASSENPIHRIESGCAITPASSFYKLKGFCKGADAERNGQAGFKKIKRPVGAFTTAIVAKCNHCLYELDYKAVEEDSNNDSSASRTSNSVGYRVRILQKCHLPTRVIDEHLFGCIFCVQTGRTLEESDATVFFTKNQLWAHLARHPRPFPKVAGVTVVETGEMPLILKDNFDLHFPHPSIDSVMPGKIEEISRLPTALAVHTKRISQKSMRLPPDHQPVLQFAVGAKIVGIEFPVKYDGKWAVGWHDGVHGAFETDAVHFEAPPKTEIKDKGTSNVTAMARWKWNQKGDERWLKFDRWDIINNITWVYTDHWCWSGSTPKGWGVFPQSHLDPESIRVHEPKYLENATSPEKKNPLKFSFRTKKDDRKTSSFSAQGNTF